MKGSHLGGILRNGPLPSSPGLTPATSRHPSLLLLASLSHLASALSTAPLPATTSPPSVAPPPSFPASSSLAFGSGRLTTQPCFPTPSLRLALPWLACSGSPRAPSPHTPCSAPACDQLRSSAKPSLFRFLSVCSSSRSATFGLLALARLAAPHSAVPRPCPLSLISSRPHALCLAASPPGTPSLFSSFLLFFCLFFPFPPSSPAHPRPVFFFFLCHAHCRLPRAHPRLLHVASLSCHTPPPTPCPLPPAETYIPKSLSLF